MKYSARILWKYDTPKPVAEFTDTVQELKPAGG